jgi:uncharacterized repeat protein (TIGR01451 family)
VDSVDCYIRLNKILENKKLRQISPYLLSDSLIRFRLYDLAIAEYNKVTLAYKVPAGESGEIEYNCGCYSFGKEKKSDSLNNTTKFKKQIRNANDPNDKQVSPEGHFVTPGQHFDYFIRFQNTGTAPAGNVIIRDTLSAFLDTNTVELVASSHNCSMEKRSNKLAFYFLQIELPDSNTNKKESQGWVRFRVKSLSTLAGNTEINNKVSIYFDYEKPVVTNTAKTKFTPIPRINLLGTVEGIMSVCSSFSDAGAVAFDTLDGDLSSKIKVTGGIRYNSIDDDTLFYSVTNSSGYEASTFRIVHKVDNFKPHLRRNGKYLVDNEIIHLPVFSTFSDGVSSTDSCMPRPLVTRIPGANGDVNTSKTGVYTISYFASDESGNKAYEDGYTLQYFVYDSISPIISLNTADTICHPINTAYISVDASATDNYSTPDKISITRSGAVNAMVKGLYTEMFIATDESGNKDTAYRYVLVGDCGPASVSKTAAHSITIWPNPGNGEFSVGGLGAGNYTLKLYNIHGQNIPVFYQRVGDNIEVNAQVVTSGLYIIEISSDIISVRKNIVVTR